MNEEIEELSSEEESSEEVSQPKKKKGNKLGPYIRTCQRKALLILGMVSLTTSAAYFASSNDPNTYVGSFRVLVEPVNSTDKLTEASTLTRTGGLPKEELFALDYPTQLEILKSSSMMSLIAQTINDEYPNISADALKIDLIKNLIVSRIGTGRLNSTKILEVVYQASNPNLAQLVLETTAEQYLKYSLDERQTSIKAGVKFIEEQIPDLQKQAGNLQAKLQNLQQSYQFIDPAIKAEELLAQVTQFEQQELETQRQLNELQGLYNSLQKQLNLTPGQALTASALTQDPQRTTLLAQLQEIESQIAFESSRFTTNSPRLRSLEEQKQQIVSLLNEKTQQILGSNSSSVAAQSQVLTFPDPMRLDLIGQLVNTDNQIKSLETRYQSLQTTRKNLGEKANEFPEVFRQHNEIARQLSLTNNILDRLWNQRQTLLVEGAQQGEPWELLSPPQLALDEEGNPLPFPPDAKKKLIAGFMGGVLLGVGIAVGLEKRRNLFYTADDMADILAMPLLGNIPLESTDKEPNNLAPLETEPDQLSPFLAFNQDVTVPLESENFVESNQTQVDNNHSEALFLDAFDALYTNLRFTYNTSGVSSLVVCSVESEDGQSTVAVHLAQAAAAKGERVLLVDANWRQPQLHDCFDLPNYKGLINLLSDGNLTIEEVVQKVPSFEHLYVLSAGVDRYDARQPLWSTNMESLNQKFQSDYDLVIYDPPHFLDSGDISFLIDNTDGVLMVAKIAKTAQSQIKQALERINTFNLPSVGVVATFNQK